MVGSRRSAESALDVTRSRPLKSCRRCLHSKSRARSATGPCGEAGAEARSRGLRRRSGAFPNRSRQTGSETTTHDAYLSQAPRWWHQQASRRPSPCRALQVEPRSRSTAGACSLCRSERAPRCSRWQGARCRGRATRTASERTDLSWAAPPRDPAQQLELAG